MDVVRRFIPCVHEDLVDSEFHDEMIDEQPFVSNCRNVNDTLWTHRMIR